MDNPLVVLLLLLNVALLVALLRRPGVSPDVATALALVQDKLRAVGERIQALEQQHTTSLLEHVVKTQTQTENLRTATEAIRNQLGETQQALAALRAQAEAAQRTAESVRRLEMILAGTQTKGAAGENVLELVFAKLPPEWQERNFRIGNRVVEFGLRLPNNLILPIDSKWPATDLIERLAKTDDPAEQQRLKEQIERTVLEKAREVRKYLDPSLTASFGVAVVPDAVYDLCGRVQSEAFQLNVVLVGHSMFVPYLLLVFQMTLRTSQNVDLEKLQQYLATVEQSAAAIQRQLEGRFSSALKMLQNARDELRAHVSKIRGSLTGMQVSAGPPVAALAPPAHDGSDAASG
jgi:DNA recombination protein RmuC